MIFIGKYLQVDLQCSSLFKLILETSEAGCQTDPETHLVAESQINKEQDSNKNDDHRNEVRIKMPTN